jgi:hypothetical protein
MGHCTESLAVDWISQQCEQVGPRGEKRKRELHASGCSKPLHKLASTAAAAEAPDDTDVSQAGGGSDLIAMISGIAEESSKGESTGGVLANLGYSDSESESE